MSDNKIILKNKIFRRYIYAYLITLVNIWVIPTLTPILLNKHFGIGQEFAFSIGLQWLPSILLGPITAFLISKWGPHKMYISVMFFYSAILALLSFASNSIHIQLLIFALGIGQAIASPSSLTLRAYVIPIGLEVAGNSIIIGIQRLSKILGPLLAGLLVLLSSVEMSFLVSSLLCIPSIIALCTIPLSRDKGNINKSNKSEKSDFKVRLLTLYKASKSFLIHEKLLMGLFVTAVGYTITLGALKIYLFSLADILGDSEQIYSFLLASQGFGALIGAIFSQVIISRLQKKLTLAKIYALVSIAEGLTLLLINIDHNLVLVTCVLIIAAIFETLAFVTYFTLLQKKISKEKQGIFNSLTMPIIDSSYLIGVVLLGFIIDKYSLSFILYIVVSFTILTVLMFIKPFIQEKL
ncbi:MFS transporter [Gracilibacillus sp. S3-1-1]|uniref:MFS transporter n=1 Tax=Gracilibacillus pellucidus TaxID=3095368 RepID=A0ACC6M859_9BACI|nr:MFS transporter [Gracilibacillus sp. S3-1-1]MDX8047027.1 MFS transporter [Gracilibacillus sp. S3-1-1]